MTLKEIKKLNKGDIVVYHFNDMYLECRVSHRETRLVEILFLTELENGYVYNVPSEDFKHVERKEVFRNKRINQILSKFIPVNR